MSTSDNLDETRKRFGLGSCVLCQLLEAHMRWANQLASPDSDCQEGTVSVPSLPAPIQHELIWHWERWSLFLFNPHYSRGAASIRWVSEPPTFTLPLILFTLSSKGLRRTMVTVCMGTIRGTSNTMRTRGSEVSLTAGGREGKVNRSRKRRGQSSQSL